MSGVNNVGNNYANQTTQVQNQNTQNTQNTQNNQKVKEESQSKEENKVVVAEDEYAGSAAQAKTGNYNKQGKVDKDYMDSVKAGWKNNTAAFEAMVNGSKKSGNASLDKNDPNYWANWVQQHLGQQYSVEEAQQAVSDDGYWGVEQTSQRIVDFAKNISGGDISKFDDLMGAIKKGFGAAADEWGGKMPDITKKTYDAVMEKMDVWKKEATGQGTQTENAVAATGALDK